MNMQQKFIFLFFFSFASCLGQQKSLPDSDVPSVDVVALYKYIYEQHDLNSYFDVYQFSFPEIIRIHADSLHVAVKSDNAVDKTFEYEVSLNNDFLKIENTQISPNDEKIIIELKVFDIDKRKFLVGISYHYSSRYEESASDFEFFLSESNVIIGKKTDVLNLPELSVFFDKPIAKEVFDKFICIQYDVSFTENSYNLQLSPLNTCELQCEESDKNKDMQSICDQLQSLMDSTLLYEFNSSELRFYKKP